jgi:crotonobetainyl-CoA:carnitine CoA-transferase CaiB-like acyl-CoA transferase
VGNDGQFGKLCELPADPRFATNRQRNAHRELLKLSLEAKLKQFECEPLADAHTQHRGMVVEIGDDYRGVASPVKLSRTPATYRRAPPTR